MAEGFRLLKVQQGLREGLCFEANVFEPASGRVVKHELSVGPRRRIELVDGFAQATEVTVKTLLDSGGAGACRSYVDDSWNLLKLVTSVGGATCEFVACDRDHALGSSRVKDLQGAIALECPQPISEQDRTRPISYQLLAADHDDLGIPPLSDQRVSLGCDGTVTVTVSPVCPDAGAAFPYRGDDPQLLAATRPSAFLQSDRPEIVDLARRAAGDTAGAAEAVRRVAVFVHDYVLQDKACLGYATAMDVVESRRGDCSENAVLAAAMCRALGIPARVVTGLLYEDQAVAFVPHAWAAAYVGDAWVNVDPTRVPGRLDTGHIALASGDGDPADLAWGLGRFRIVRVIVNPSSLSSGPRRKKGGP